MLENLKPVRFTFNLWMKNITLQSHFYPQQAAGFCFRDSEGIFRSVPGFVLSLKDFFSADAEESQSSPHNKQVGLEIEWPKSTRNGTMYQFFHSNSPSPASFGASLVLSTILFPRNWALFRLNTEFKKVEYPTDVEYHTTCSIYQIFDLNISDCRYWSCLSLWVLVGCKIPCKLRLGESN